MLAGRLLSVTHKILVEKQATPDRLRGELSSLSRLRAQKGVRACCSKERPTGTTNISDE